MRLFLFFAILAGGLFAAAAIAGNYPARLITPQPAGASMDIALCILPPQGGDSPDQFAAFMCADCDRIARLVKTAGIKPE